MTNPATNQTPILPIDNANQNADQNLVQYPEFTQDLVQAMYGVPLGDFRDDKKKEIADRCTNIYQNFMISYFKENYVESDYFRLQQAKFQPDLFAKFPDLTQKFVTAYAIFLNELQKNNENN